LKKKVDIRQITLNRRIVILVQSYPAFRMVYYLKVNNHDVIVLTTKTDIRKVCNSLGIFCIMPKPVIINKYIIYYLPNAIKNILQNYLINLSSKFILKKLSKKNNVDFIITILGMDRAILPAFLNFKKAFYYWDDSFYANRWKSDTLKIVSAIKIHIQNFLFSTHYKLFNDEMMKNFPWTARNSLPDNCTELISNLDTSISQSLPPVKSFDKMYDLVILGGYDFYEFSKKCNIVKLINLVEKLQDRYPDKVFYKAHPGTKSLTHKVFFGTNEVESFMPIEIIGNSCKVVLTLGSAAVVSLKKTSAEVVGIGKLVDMCDDLYEMAKIQGLNNVDSWENLILLIDNLYSSEKTTVD
jgi:hypothetical protein